MASEDLLKKAVAAFNALSPEQQAEMLEEQRQSWVRGNVGLSRDERGMTSPVMPRPTTAMASEYCKFPHCECSMGAAERCKRIRTRRAPVDANPLTSNSVDDKIVPDTNSNAPTATDTGLVTVEHQYWHDQTQEWLPTGFPDRYRKDGFLVRELVTRSQAEELLAEEIRRERDLAEKQLSEVVDRMSDDHLALKAELDQAVGVIEDRSSEYEALEAKLTAAEKALKSARPYVEDYDTRRHNTGVDETLTQIDAALGGKPL